MINARIALPLRRVPITLTLIFSITYLIHTPSAKSDFNSTARGIRQTSYDIRTICGKALGLTSLPKFEFDKAPAYRIRTHRIYVETLAKQLHGFVHVSNQPTEGLLKKSALALVRARLGRIGIEFSDIQPGALYMHSGIFSAINQIPRPILLQMLEQSPHLKKYIRNSIKIAHDFIKNEDREIGSFELKPDLVQKLVFERLRPTEKLIDVVDEMSEQTRKFLHRYLGDRLYQIDLDQAVSIHPVDPERWIGGTRKTAFAYAELKMAVGHLLALEKRISEET